MRIIRIIISLSRNGMPSRHKPALSLISLAVLCALSFSAVLPGFASAQDSLPAVTVTATKDKDGYVAPTSSSGTKTEMALRDVPQSINVVPAAIIRDQHALSIQDVMKNIPGVGLSTGDGQRDQVFIRGFTAIGDQFVDGFRDDALYFRDLSNVERLEVIKGPAAVLYARLPGDAVHQQAGRGYHGRGPEPDEYGRAPRR